MRKSGKRGKIRFGGDEEEREKREDMVWGMRKSGERRKRRKIRARFEEEQKA
ncbi:hypothetical protein [Photobacterium damselae]|uniref:hypothetical protein n=1 Tax=Photobacterium damselae TaxID=38293 RepID=UPI0015E64AD1|nr:hypothetical protein [Photobacterium damselae]